ncbi:hypothetical protein HAX54_040810, partial [Datura stramonium]|nr:hypothetical protein [Datura stramonium]
LGIKLHICGTSFHELTGRVILCAMNQLLNHGLWTNLGTKMLGMTTTPTHESSYLTTTHGAGHPMEKVPSQLERVVVGQHFGVGGIRGARSLGLATGWGSRALVVACTLDWVPVNVGAQVMDESRCLWVPGQGLCRALGRLRVSEEKEAFVGQTVSLDMEIDEESFIDPRSLFKAS